MSIRLQSRFCLFCFLICLVLAGSSVAFFYLGKKAPKPVQMVAQVNDTLQLDYIELNLKTIKTKKTRKVVYPQQMLISKGDTLTVLGVAPVTKYKIPRFWVETADGTRGFVWMDVLERKATVTGVIDKDFPLKRRDSVEILSAFHSPEHSTGYTVRRLSDGQIFEHISGDILTTPTAKKLLRRAVHVDAYHVMHRSDFLSNYMGKTLQQTDSLGVPALSKIWYNDTLRVAYPLKVYCPLKIFHPLSGKFIRPIVCYGKDSVAMCYEYQTYKTHCNAWLLKILPKIDWVYKMPWTPLAMDKPLFRFAFPSYGAFGALTSSSFLNLVLGLIGAIFIGVYYLLWIVLWFWSVPMLFMGFAGWPIVYKIIPNKVLLGFITLLSLVWWYFCKAMMYCSVCWLLYIPITFFAWIVLMDYFLQKVIKERCNKCKHLGRIRKISYDLVKEYDTDWIPETKEGNLIDKRSGSWDTWTDVMHTTTTYQDGFEIGTSSYTTRENRKHHTKTYRTYRMHDYLVRYHVKVYQTTYKCDNCGDITYKTTKDRKKIDQKYVGSHTETRTSYSVE